MLGMAINSRHVISFTLRVYLRTLRWTREILFRLIHGRLQDCESWIPMEISEEGTERIVNHLRTVNTHLRLATNTTSVQINSFQAAKVAS
jgi:hypothetical protein